MKNHSRMMKPLSQISALILAVITPLSSCSYMKNESASCYRTTDEGVFLRYYGGYPRGEWVSMKVRNADQESFRFIEGSREGSCQGGHVYAADRNHVYYQISEIPGADPKSFAVLGNGYARDRRTVFYTKDPVPGADLESFFAVPNARRRPFAADTHGIYLRTERVINDADVRSFELLFPPYFRDKNRVYYSRYPNRDFLALEGADPATFTCPAFDQIINYQYYAYDKNRAYFFEGHQLEIIPNIDRETFNVLGFYYAKDKNHVYYRAKILEGADPATFHRPLKIHHDIGQDKNHRFKNGLIVEESPR